MSKTTNTRRIQAIPGVRDTEMLAIARSCKQSCRWTPTWIWNTAASMQAEQVGSKGESR